MRRAVRSAFMTMSVVFGAGLLACGGDDNPTGPGKIGSSDDATATSLTYEVVVPLVRNVFLETYLDQIPTAAAVPSVTACNNLGCSSGSGQICSGTGTLDLTFSQCQAFGTVLDGSVSLNLAAGSGSGTFAVTVGGDFEMAGNVSYAADATCFSQYFTEVSLTAGDLEMTMTGSAFWCDPRAMVGNVVVPSYANFDFEIPSLDRTVSVSVLSSSAGSLEIVILNLARTKILRACNGSLLGSSLDCFAGPDA